MQLIADMGFEAELDNMNDSHFSSIVVGCFEVQWSVKRNAMLSYDKLVITTGVGCVQTSGLGLVPFAFRHFSQDD